MSVAVVVPVHDGARYLEATIASVRAQTVAVDEFVVVDDGSTDDSAALAERLGVRCIRQPNRGPAAARNRGVDATTAELIAFLDADDLFLPDKLRLQLPCLRDAGIVACCSDAWVRRDEQRGAAKNGDRQVGERITFGDLLAGNPVICSSVVLRRTAFVAAGGFDPDPVLIATEDYDLWLRIARLGAFAYERRPLVEYRVHPQSLSSSERFLRGVDRAMDKIEAWCGEDSGVREAVRRRRGAVRVDAAWDALQRGDRRRARTLLRDAREHGVWGWKERRLWLRTLV